MVLSSGLDGRRRDFQVGKNIVCNLTDFFLLPCLVECILQFDAHYARKWWCLKEHFIEEDFFYKYILQFVEICILQLYKANWTNIFCSLMLNMRENFGAQIQTWWEKKRFSRGVSAKREMGKGFRWFEGRLAKILETIICIYIFTALGSEIVHGRIHLRFYTLP